MEAVPNPSVKVEHESEDPTQNNTADMKKFVQNLLVQMQTRFEKMSENIVAKLDEMGSRIDELEQSINDLKTEMEADGATKLTPERSKPAEESS